MSFRDRFDFAKRRMRHCNYVLFGFIIAVAGAWDQIKPALVDLLARFMSPAAIDLTMSVLGISLMLVRLWPAPPSDEESH